MLRSTFGKFAKWYQGKVHHKLGEYGLRVEDIMNAENPDLQRALKYIPKSELMARQRRIARAVDLSMKHEVLPKHIQEVQEPSKMYLVDLMQEFKQLREERELLKR